MTGGETGLAKGLSKNFWLFVSGRFVSQIGWAIQDVAIPLYVLDKTHSGAMMSLFILAELLPGLILLPIAGVLGDRYNRKNLMVLFDISRGAILLGVVFLGFFELSQLLIVSIIIGSLNPFFSSATSAMFPELVNPDDLERANSIASSSNIISRLVGPALGGLLYGLGGIILPLLVNGISFFGSGIFEIAIRYKGRTKRITRLREVIEDMKSAFIFLKSSKYLLTLIGFALFLNALGSPFAVVLMPYSYREILHFTSLQFGLLESAFMLGAFLGNMIIAIKLGRTAGKYIFHSLAINGAVLLFFVWLVSPASLIYGYMAFITMAGVSIIWGSSESFLNVPINSKIQRAVPNEYMGRVFSLLIVLVNAVTPVGVVVVGPLIDMFSAWVVALGMWFLMLLVVIYYYARHGSTFIEEQN